MKYFFSLLLVSLIAVWSIQAQSFNEYKKTEEENFTKFKNSQREGLNNLRQAYNNFVKNADKNFANYLKRQWVEYQLFAKMHAPDSPKPLTAPQYKLNPDSNKEIRAIIPRKIQIRTDIPSIMPLVQNIEPKNIEKAAVKINYFGSDFTLNYDKKIHNSFSGNPTGRDISVWWLKVSQSDYNYLISQLLQLKNRMSLNDWAYFLLVKEVAAAISDKENEASLLSWFLMIRSGYDIKIAYSKHKVYVLYPSVNNVYEKNFVVIGGQRYYVMQSVLEHSFHIFDRYFPGSTQKIDFTIKQPLNIGHDIVKKNFNFTFNGKRYSINIVEDLNTLEFMKKYPQTDLQVFFNSAISFPTKQSIAESIMPIIAHMNNRESLDFLLSFVQKAFLYKTDSEQFGREKYFFPEEVFYYKYSDCEDRAALFSSLVGQLLHLNVIGLEYHGHVATAVQLKDMPFGNYISFQGKRFVIADPTYINAPLGVEMPKYCKEEPIIFGVNRNEIMADAVDKYWHLANEAGGYRGGNLNDAVFDKDGDCYLTGYYIGTARFGNAVLYSDSRRRQGFLVKYNKNREPVWAHNIKTNGVSTGFALTLNANKSIIVAGSFNGKISFGHDTISSTNGLGDVFFACYTPGGGAVWLRKAGLDTLNRTSYLSYVIKFNPGGNNFVSQLYFDNDKEPTWGFSHQNKTFTFIGGLNNTTGLNYRKQVLNESKDFGITSYLKGINDNLIKENVNKNIAGLVAAIYLANNNGIIIPGDSVQIALDKYNPSFKVSYPTIYNTIGKIDFIKNSEGIVKIKTKNDKSISFKEMKINNGAQLKLVSLKDGKQQVDVLSGIKVGKLFIWYTLNFIQILPKTGDLLFDFDTDHTHKVLNLKNDILY